MTLRTQLKGVKMQMTKNIQSYFTRVSQIKEQLEAIWDNIEEVEVEMNTLNGLPRSWEYFIQGICSRMKLTGKNTWKKRLDWYPEKNIIIPRR